MTAEGGPCNPRVLGGHRPPLQGACSAVADRRYRVPLARGTPHIYAALTV
jgi:hypothetical protein